MQDAEMHSMYNRFPEVLIVDATHKVNSNNIPLYGLMIMDGNGESQLAAAFIVQKEDKPTLRRMIQTFKELNPTWQDTEVVAADKDFVEMPQAWKYAYSTPYKPSKGNLHQKRWA